MRRNTIEITIGILGNICGIEKTDNEKIPLRYTTEF
jgi:hypothetical protein